MKDYPTSADTSHHFENLKVGELFLIQPHTFAVNIYQKVGANKAIRIRDGMTREMSTSEVVDPAGKPVDLIKGV